MLGLLLYILYTADLKQMATRHDELPHQYVDDRFTISVTISDTTIAMDRFTVC